MDDDRYVMGEPALDYLLRNDTICRVYEEKLVAQGRDPATDPLAQTRRRHFRQRLATVAPDIRRQVEERVAERDTRVGRMRWLQERCDRMIIEAREDRALRGFWLSDDRPTLRALREEIRSLYEQCTPEDRAALGGSVRLVRPTDHGRGPISAGI